MDTIYISDLDGTLVNDNAELSKYAIQNLNALIADGLPLTVASARSIVSIQQMLNGIELPLPVICFNGALFFTVFQVDTKGLGLHLFVSEKAHATRAK